MDKIHFGLTAEIKNILGLRCHGPICGSAKNTLSRVSPLQSTVEPRGTEKNGTDVQSFPSSNREGKKNDEDTGEMV